MKALLNNYNYPQSLKIVIVYYEGENIIQNTIFEDQTFILEDTLMKFVEDNIDEIQNEYGMYDIEYIGPAPHCFCNIYRSRVKKYILRNPLKAFKYMVCGAIRMIQTNTSINDI